jgi:CBS domain-containing membrane protein
MKNKQHILDLSATPLSAIMTTDLIIVKPTDSLKVAADAFRKNNFHHLPVLNEKGELAGMFSKSDFLRVGNAWAVLKQKKGDPLDNEDELYNGKITIGEVMTHKLVKLGPNDTVGVAVGIFKENLFQSIPIVEKDVLLGLVTTFDLLKLAFQAHELI